MREVTKEWIFKAEGDYRSADALLHEIEVKETQGKMNSR